MIFTPRKDSDQPVHPRSLISFAPVCFKKTRVLSYPFSTKQRLWSDWADTQPDLSLRWAHRSFCLFCRVVGHFLFPLCEENHLQCLCGKIRKLHWLNIRQIWATAQQNQPGKDSYQRRHLSSRSVFAVIPLKCTKELDKTCRSASLLCAHVICLIHCALALS